MFISVYSQNGVNVYVVNENDEPLSGTVAYVLTLDSLFINSMIANEDGIINIPSVDFQKQMIKILAFGYNNFDILEMPADNTIKVKLTPLNVDQLAGEFYSTLSGIIIGRTDSKHRSHN
jgi:hypothetical protein